MCLLVGRIHIYQFADGGARVVVLIVANSSLTDGQSVAFSVHLIPTTMLSQAAAGP